MSYENGVNKVRGIPFQGFVGKQTSGKIFHVSSTHTNAVDDTAHGEDPNYPFATIDYAFGQCTADRGDTIYVYPNHAESIAAANAVAQDVAGTSVIGLWQPGTNKPTVTAATAAAAEWDISAANCTVSGLLFVCNIASQTAMISVAAGGDGAVIEDCEFQEGSATGLNFITLADADDVTIRNCRFFAPTAGNYNDAISIDAALDRLTIENCFIKGDFDDAGIHNPTGNVATNLLIKDCIVENELTGQHAIELVSACTGFIVDCHLAGDTSGTILDPGSCRIHGTTESSAIDVPASTSPAAAPTDAADNILGADNNNNAFASTNVAANKDGSIIERLEQIMEAVNPDSGTSLAATESLADILYATNGIATYPASAAPANGVSIAEVLRDLWDAVRNGTGGAEPATNRSVMDYLGVSPAFYSPGLGYVVTKTCDLSGANDDLFDVTGKIMVTSITGEVTTVLSGAESFQLRIKTDNVALCAATTINTDADGTHYILTLDFGDAMCGGSTPGLRAAEKNTLGSSQFVMGDAGGSAVIESNTTGNGGAILFTMTYIPLEASATVAASA